MNEKRRFIQAVFARTVPAEHKFMDGLAYAERLWAFLTQHGYGDPVKDGEKKPRVSHDYYAELDERQKRFFNAFWEAFNFKQARNEAAQAWLALGALTNDDYQKIIAAAEREAKRQRPEGQARMFAQGWLNRKRFDDYLPTPKHANNVVDLSLTHLSNQLNGVKRLYETSQDPALLPQIDKLEHALREARKPKGE